MTLALLADSAMRSLLLGAAVWTLLKLARLRDSRTETLIWTMVLVAALFMPLLVQWLPGIALPLFSLPHFADPAPSAEIASATTTGPPAAGSPGPS